MSHLTLNSDKQTHFKHLCRTTDMKCKFCGSDDVVRYGIQNGIQQYFCNTCKRKFGDKDTLEGRHTPTAEIGAALGMFFDGLSLSKISYQLKWIYSDNVNPSTIYRWIMEYSQKAKDLLKGYEIKVGNTWVVDETGIDINGKNMWFWDIIDEDTRFLLASHISQARTIEDVAIVMKKAQERAGRYPIFILSDKWRAYKLGIKQAFGSHSIHIKSQGFTGELNINLIERFHGTLKERIKVLRSFKSLATARTILDGFIINYNFFRPHMTLKDTTPAKEAGLKLPFKTWEGLLRELQYHLQ